MTFLEVGVDQAPAPADGSSGPCAGNAAGLIKRGNASPSFAKMYRFLSSAAAGRCAALRLQVRYPPRGTPDAVRDLGNGFKGALNCAPYLNPAAALRRAVPPGGLDVRAGTGRGPRCWSTDGKPRPGV